MKGRKKEFMETFSIFVPSLLVRVQRNFRLKFKISLNYNLHVKYICAENNNTYEISCKEERVLNKFQFFFLAILHKRNSLSFIIHREKNLIILQVW